MRAGAVWRALDRARALNLRDSEAASPFGGDGITRRRVLAALGTGAAVTTLPGCFRAQAPRVAVIGGGLAGTVALNRLRSAGIDATLYEARAAVGGRTRSVHGVFAADYAFDEGGQLVNSDHADMLALIRMLRLRLIDRKSAPHGELQIGRSGRVDEHALAEGLRSIAAQISADSDRLDKNYAQVAREIDALSVSAYLDRHQMSAGDARDALEAAIRTEYGAEPHEASALELLFNLPTIDGKKVTRLSLSDEKYLIDGGTAQVAQRLAALHGSEVRLRKQLKAVEFDQQRVRLSFADGEQSDYASAIVALPAPLLRDIQFKGPLPPAWQALMREVNLGRNEKLITGYDQPVWRDAIGGGGALWAAKGFSEAWDAASSPQQADAAGAITYFTGGDQVAAAAASSARELAGRFTDEARLVLPRLPDANGRLRRTNWCSDPLTKGSYINFRPGQLTRFGSLLTLEKKGQVRTSGSGRLFFAGEWLSDAWPGYMNGAAQTGRIAATAAIAALKEAVR